MLKLKLKERMDEFRDVPPTVTLRKLFPSKKVFCVKEYSHTKDEDEV